MQTLTATLSTVFDPLPAVEVVRGVFVMPEPAAELLPLEIADGMPFGKLKIVMSSTVIFMISVFYVCFFATIDCIL